MDAFAQREQKDTSSAGVLVRLLRSSILVIKLFNNKDIVAVR